mmetsp:Transcript_6864/g.7854  ORF Transcript_6864/g.7854 Transcript_6864/m.7854 type:complete len:451 (+) Transcript_6864:176-1528(+)|eukprot:CAMPEP_0184018674 /NCGR_PEP_ID=MMETSP0954-20121128/8282_1 /TAXON_ID=627963 /ORGANISM="Aplanochytrium sp, Strain PBS07" /LENGTH=450 /DNA_ID=CAMNT_0026300165 /DNA_START=299 /DNA_END=1648 /DNA_ORIENTATION=-
MPWLVKDEVLFIHVPRCGGTSITKFHKVAQQAEEGYNLYYRLGLRYYYYRYKVLESANFPFMTYENLLVLFQVTLATVLLVFVPQLPENFPAPYVMYGMACTLFINSTFVWTAPVLMRYNFLRRLLMYVQHYVFCGLGCDIRFLVGTNNKGYLFHLTAERCLRYNYVTEAEMKKCSFSIVRNPFSRMVSVFEYNKRLGESFEHFVTDFHSRCLNRYHGKGQTDSWDIYCHVIPMHAYTHINGKQVINTIIKQEQLKRLVASDWKGVNVPPKIQKALTGIPHANRRVRKIAWHQYYNQATMDMVLEMYAEDFDIFGYEKTIPNRPDLAPRVEVDKRRVAFSFDRVQELAEMESSKVDPIQTSSSTARRDSTHDSSTNGVKSNQVNQVDADLGSDLPIDLPKKRRATLSVSESGSARFQQGYYTPRASSVSVQDEEMISRRRSASAFVLANQ